MIGADNSIHGHSNAGFAGGGAITPTPGDLSNMLLWISSDSFTTAVSAHTPGTPYHMTGTQPIVNLAAGGPTLDWRSGLASNRPYYHTADWVLTEEPVTVPQPNGQTYFGTNAPDDTGLTSCPVMGISPGAPTSTSHEVNVSGIIIMHFVQDSAVARRIFENPGADGYRKLDISEDRYFQMDDDVGVAELSVTSADIWEDTWQIITWTKGSGTWAGAANGVRIPETGNETLLTGSFAFDRIWPLTQMTTVYTDLIYYEAGHTLADLDVPAAQFATKYGITYTAP